MSPALAGVTAFLVCSVLVFPMKRVAARVGMIDRPRSDRHHREPTPYLGGVAIMAGVLIAAAVALGRPPHVLAVLAAALTVGVIGLVDDAVGFGPRPKLIVEIAAALLAVSFGTRLALFPWPVDAVLTVIWLTILTNSFNLIDNMDGALSAVGIAIAGLVVVGGLEGGQRVLVVEAAILLGALAGFLLHNWNPARVFMGDAGSLFLGFLLAAMVLDLHFESPAQRVVAMLLLMGPALFDTTLVVISRLRSGRPISIGATDHTAHRLARLGLSTRVTVMALFAGSLALGGAGLLAGEGVLAPLVALSVSAVAGLMVLGALLRLPAYPSSAEEPQAPRAGSGQPIRTTRPLVAGPEHGTDGSTSQTV
jgi:UDP-GlcNAc:undecaprenyl-phosphate GlcNAc-1-phosphate transferase